MINVELKGGAVKEFENGTTPAEIAKSIGAGLYKSVCCAKVDGDLCDLRTPLEKDCKVELLTFDNVDGQKTFWHTASHVLAQAVKRLYPNAKCAIGPAVDNGFYYDGEKISPAKHPYYFAGLYYLQEPSAMTPASRLPIEPDDRVLDLCAAPGGKATELGSRIGEGGMLLANDISNSRAKALLRNLEIQGVGRLLVTSEDPEKLVTLYPAFFDKILLDAPCSGEGMFRKESSMLRYYSENGPEHYVPIQKKLIEQAYQMLAEGGELLYSTCTFSVKENEEVIAGLLDAHPDMEVQEITPGYEGFAPGVSVNGRDLSRCVHIFPQRMEGEGHFVSLFKKQGESRKRQPSRLLETTKKLPKEAEGFLAGVRMNWKNGSFALVKDQLYFLPEGVCAAKGLRYLRTGLSLGTVKKNRFEPSQALAAYLKKEEYVSCLTIPKGDDRVMRYLKGETLSFSEEDCQGKKGWVLVCLDDFPLGWGKINNGTLKNKYYAGWRMV